MAHTLSRERPEAGAGGRGVGGGGGGRARIGARMVIRSLLFAPANRPDLVAKLPRSGADAVAIDLEDGTPEQEKAAARLGLAGGGSRPRGRGGARPGRGPPHP